MPRHNPYPVPDEPGRIVPVEVRGWQDGYDAGISSPSRVPPTPLVRDPGYADGWTRGARAGNADGGAEGWRWACFDGAARPSPGEAGGRYAHRDSGERSAEYAQVFTRCWPCVGERPLLVLLAAVAPGQHGGEGLTGRVLARTCAGKGVSQLYLPVGLKPSPAPDEGAGDPLTHAGYWHGGVHESLDEAAPEAIDHVLVRVVRFAALVRYRPAAEHHFFDLLPVYDMTAPGRPA
ncbi:hypothetical protein HCJ93_05610 [Streptomyces sp. SBST2-5]|uniref:Uncharacterized protein n=1 Tax=Streptomyces composti TaxID=2720025 RepID=A0ABX0ZZN6_9ACTN|nr:hypothetical protein [Streptomyces composti]NJP49564.1 hypothetical protein [Streptomyces composti]